MSFPIGINFRATSGYVTDGTNEYGYTASTLYPTTLGGESVGWVAGLDNSSARDRNSGIDRRLAGLHFTGNTAGGAAKHDFKVALPSAGAYDIWIGAGDNSGQAIITLELFDNASSLATILSAADTTGAAKFFDATGTLRASAAAWTTAYAASYVTYTFSSTTFILRMGGTGGVSNSVINHVMIQANVPSFTPKTNNAWSGYIGAKRGSRAVIQSKVADLVDRFGRPLRACPA